MTAELNIEVEAWCLALKEIRLAKDLSQQALADLAKDFDISITVSSLSGWESGRHWPKLETFWKVARCTGAEPDEIWGAWGKALEKLKTQKRDKPSTAKEIISMVEKEASRDPAVAAELARMVERLGDGKRKQNNG